MTQWAAIVPEQMVADLTRSIKFYCEVFGATVRFRRAGPAFAYLDVGVGQIMLEEDHEGAWVTRPAEYPRGRGVNLQIEVGSVREVMTAADRVGTPVFRPLAETWYATEGVVEEGQLELLVLDPDGYLLRAIEPIGSRVRRPV